VLKIGCRGGALQILELQLAGKKRLATAEFLRGFDHDSLDKVK
jgi:methionyl-tRNA formyltransferase